MILTAQRVDDVFRTCLFSQEEDLGSPVIVEGMHNKVAFNQERLTAHADEIRYMLNQLPEGFHFNTGGGMSFLAALNNKQGQQWTGEHQIMEFLFLLGMAIGMVSYCLPRDMWEVLPGAMPYYVVKL